MIVRKASPNDCLSLGKVYCLSWQKGYQDILPDEFLASLTVENCSPTPEKISSKKCFVCEYNESIIGLTSFGIPRDNDAETLCEIQTLYVLPDFWGKGAGEKLFKAACTVARESGYTGIYLWTLKENSRARHFYDKMRMTYTGQEREITIGGKAFAECRYMLDFV